MGNNTTTEEFKRWAEERALEIFSEEEDFDIDFKDCIYINISPKTYAILVLENIFNVHSKGVISDAYHVNALAIKTHLDFSVSMLLENYEAIKLANKLFPEAHSINIGVRTSMYRLKKDIKDHFHMYSPESNTILKDKENKYD
tara:strand:- start:220 stop:648 length:429 start_codon:yes stop_codon:yes gene_type:complete